MPVARLPSVGGGVDAARQAGDDAETLAAEFGGERARELHAGERGVARADDGDRGQGEDGGLALHGEQGRRVVHALQQRRIVRLADADETRAVLFGRLQLGLRPPRPRGCGSGGQRRRRPQVGQRLDRGVGRAEAVDEVAKAGGADVRGADEPQPGEPLPVAEFWCDRLARSSLAADPRFRAGEEPGYVGAVLDEDDDAQSAANISARSGRPMNQRAMGISTQAVSAASDEIAEDDGHDRARRRGRRGRLPHQAERARRYRWRRPCRP